MGELQISAARGDSSESRGDVCPQLDLRPVVCGLGWMSGCFLVVLCRGFLLRRLEIFAALECNVSNGPARAGGDSRICCASRQAYGYGPERGNGSLNC